MILKFVFIMGQLYWHLLLKDEFVFVMGRLILKDDQRDEVIYRACLYPGQ